MNRTEKFWNRAAEQADKQDNEMDKTSIITVERTKKHLNSSDIVLDFACGTGILTNEIAGNVKTVHAIDITPKMIEVARRKAAERNIGNISYEQSTIFDERLKTATYDVILAFNVLHLLEDMQRVVRRINELLKQDGLFVSATACMGEKSKLLGILISLLSRMGLFPYLKILKTSELRELIVESSFRIVEAESLNPATSSYFIVAKKN